MQPTEAYSNTINKLSDIVSRLDSDDDKEAILNTAEFLTYLVSMNQFHSNILTALCVVYGKFFISNQVISRFSNDPPRFTVEYLKDGSGIEIASSHLNLADVPEQKQ